MMVWGQPGAFGQILWARGTMGAGYHRAFLSVIVMRQAWDLANRRAQGHNGKARGKHKKCKSLGAKNFT